MSDLFSVTSAALPICIVAFMVCNLVAVGLGLEVRGALAPLANLRFVTVVMLLDWLLGPAFAWPWLQQCRSPSPTRSGSYSSALRQQRRSCR